MIEAFTIATAHRFQDAFASQARLRHRVFVEQRGLDHPTFGGLEFDEFDTPAAIYLVWRDDDRVVRGLARLLPTIRRYMLQTHWPHLVDRPPLPRSPAIFEATRVCVDKDVDPAARRKIFPELLCAIQETLPDHGGGGMVGVTKQHLLSHFVRNGIEWLGAPAVVEGEIERAFFVPRYAIRPTYHCSRYGIAGAVLADAEAAISYTRAA